MKLRICFQVKRQLQTLLWESTGQNAALKEFTSVWSRALLVSAWIFKGSYQGPSQKTFKETNLLWKKKEDLYMNKNNRLKEEERSVEVNRLFFQKEVTSRVLRGLC